MSTDAERDDTFIRCYFCSSAMHMLDAEFIRDKQLFTVACVTVTPISLSLKRSSRQIVTLTDILAGHHTFEHLSTPSSFVCSPELGGQGFTNLGISLILVPEVRERWRSLERLGSVAFAQFPWLSPRRDRGQESVAGSLVTFTYQQVISRKFGKLIGCLFSTPLFRRNGPHGCQTC